MIIIEPQVEIYRETDHLKKIETIARVCTGTQDKTGTKPDFVENLLKRQHGTPFEHVRMKVPFELYQECTDRLAGYKAKPYGFDSRTIYHKLYDFDFDTVKIQHASMNGRDFLYYGGKLEELAALPETDDYMTVKFFCDIGISRELCRHRQMSFMERSTRYCNMKDGIEFIRPVPFVWNTPDPLAMGNDILDHWKTNCIIAERNYQWIIDSGRSPQEARTVLPLSTATILYVTGMYSQWRDVLKLRLDKAAHPQMRYLMQMLVNLPDFPEELNEFKEMK